LVCVPQVKQLCSVRQTLKILATQVIACVVVEICLDLIRTDFERAQLKYYNFLRVHSDDAQSDFDDDDQWLVKYYVRKLIDLTTFAVVPLSVFVINVMVIYQLRRASANAVNLGRHHHRHHHHHQQQQQPSAAVTTTAMLLSTSLLYVAFSLSNWQLINDLLYLVPLGGYVGRTCDGLLLTDDARQRYMIVENAFSVLDSLYSLVYAYNVVVYVVTGTQFRAELRRLFHF